MFCPNCGKKLPDNAVKCNKCGEEFRQEVKNTETDDFLKKEKEKAEIKAKKLEKKAEAEAAKNTGADIEKLTEEDSV